MTNPSLGKEKAKGEDLTVEKTDGVRVSARGGDMKDYRRGRGEKESWCFIKTLDLFSNLEDGVSRGRRTPAGGSPSRGEILN